VQYTSAGTIEFLLDKDGNYYFMEMKHPDPGRARRHELVTGRDLVKEQIHVAAGRRCRSRRRTSPSRDTPRVPHQRGGPLTFVPSPGTIRHFFSPGGPGVRVDTFAHEGCEISPYYDSMIASS